LHALGARATLYEARRTVGGRTRSVSGVFAPGYAFDEGGQFINSDHVDMIGLVHELGLKLVERRGKGDREVQVGVEGAVVSEHQLAEELRPIAAAITADSDRLDQDHERVAVEIDAMSVSEYLDRHGMRPGVARETLEAGIRTEYGQEPHEASALQLIFNLPTVDGERVRRLGLSDERFVVEGGAGRIAQEIAARLDPSIRLGKILRRIETNPERCTLVFDDGEKVTADRVILALPAPILRTIEFVGEIPALWRALIDEVELGRNEKLIVGYDHQYWRASLGADGRLWSSKDFAEGWDAAAMAPNSDSDPGAFTYLMGGGQVDGARSLETGELKMNILRTAATAVEGLGAPNERVRRTRWCDDPMTRGAYVGFRPGQLTRFGSLMTKELPEGDSAGGFGAILFAGEWLSDAWPGYMNGAAQTGRIAANAAWQS